MDTPTLKLAKVIIRTKVIILAVLVGCLTDLGTSLSRGQDKQPAKELLPHHGIWKIEMDDNTDGTLDPGKASIHEFRISVVNNRLVGTNTNPNWANEGSMTGEITPGDASIIFIRQDGTGRKDEVRYWCGKLVRDGVFEGTYYQSLGGSGDFRMTLMNAE